MTKALVIGASRGIGRAIANRLLSDGFDVIASCRDPESVSGMNVTPAVFDVTDRAAIQAEYARLFPNDTAPGVIVYNAGIARDDVFAVMTPEEWDAVMRTNLDGFFNTVQPLVAPMIAQRGGRIVVVSSVSGLTGQPGQVNYSASKAALIAAVKALAREVGRRKILVNAVAPGVIDTDMTKALPQDVILPLIPVRRFGSPEEVAGVVSFLCGPDSTYVSGQVISVNGGLYM